MRLNYLAKILSALNFLVLSSKTILHFAVLSKVTAKSLFGPLFASYGTVPMWLLSTSPGKWQSDLHNNNEDGLDNKKVKFG